MSESKELIIEGILDNSIWGRESEVYQRIQASLLHMSERDLTALDLIIKQQLADAIDINNAAWKGEQ